MRIAYITPYQGPGLLESRPILINLALAANVKMELVSELLQGSGNTLEILSQGEVVDRRFKFYRAFQEPRLFDKAIPVFYASVLPFRFVNVLWSALWTLGLFARRHRQSPYEVVIIYNLKLPQLICGLYALIRRLPVVLEYEDDALVDVSGKIESCLVGRLYLLLVRKLLNSVAGCIGVSPHLVSAVPRDVPKVLLRGVVNEHILKLGCEPTGRKNWVVFCGTFARSKGLEQLVKAWAMVNLPDWELHIAGHGEKTEVLKEMARNDKSIVFHGLLNRDEYPKFLTKATIGINPHDVSDTPGNVFAFKIIEYLAAGTHVITTPMGPLEEELEAGITYMADNSPKTIVETLHRVINERQYKRTATEAAQQMYGPATVSKSLDTLLNQVRSRLTELSESTPVSSFKSQAGSPKSSSRPAGSRLGL